MSLDIQRIKNAKIGDYQICMIPFGNDYGEKNEKSLE